MVANILTIVPPNDPLRGRPKNKANIHIGNKIWANTNINDEPCIVFGIIFSKLRTSGLKEHIGFY